MSHEAYRKTHARVESPRDLEYRAFSEATARLLRVAEARGRAETDRPGEDLKKKIDAIHFNRRLWGALAADCRSDENALPVETRRSIVSLSEWVSRYSSEVMRRRADLEPLIEINRMMMEGLSRAAPAPSSAP